jgi:hypothetical protein
MKIRRRILSLRIPKGFYMPRTPTQTWAVSHLTRLKIVKCSNWWFIMCYATRALIFHMPCDPQYTGVSPEPQQTRLLYLYVKIIGPNLSISGRFSMNASMPVALFTHLIYTILIYVHVFQESNLAQRTHKHSWLLIYPLRCKLYVAPPSHVQANSTSPTVITGQRYCISYCADFAVWRHVSPLCIHPASIDWTLVCHKQ